MKVYLNSELRILLSVFVISHANAFSLCSFVESPNTLRCRGIGQRPHSSKYAALHIWKTKQDEQVLMEAENEKKEGIRNIFDRSKEVSKSPSTKVTTPSIPKLGEFTKFLRIETDDIWEEELSVADSDDNVQEEDNLSQNVAIGAVAISLLLGSVALFGNLDISLPQEPLMYIQQFLSNPNESLEKVVTQVESMGSLGQLYFGLIYVIAEILAIPAIPLTASAGYLFGVKEGTLIVLLSASIAAAVSFIIGRTLLRDYVEEVLEQNPKFKQLDKAIGQEGFKLMLLLRLSPIFPFALSNYLYGATSVRFWPYFFGTMFGFTPGTIAYVYTGEIGKALTLESASAEPWYVYAGALALLTGFIKIAADVATGIIDGLEDDES